MQMRSFIIIQISATQKNKSSNSKKHLNSKVQNQFSLESILGRLGILRRCRKSFMLSVCIFVIFAFTFVSPKVNSFAIQESAQSATLLEMKFIEMIILHFLRLMGHFRLLIVKIYVSYAECTLNTSNQIIFFATFCFMCCVKSLKTKLEPDTI